MQTDQRAWTKVLLFMKPFYLNCQLSCEPGISIVCCFLTGPFQTHNCFKRKLTSAWFFFQLLSQISVLQDNTLFDDCMHPWLHGTTWDFSKIRKSQWSWAVVQREKKFMAYDLHPVLIPYLVSQNSWKSKFFNHGFLSNCDFRVFPLYAHSRFQGFNL